MAAAGAPGGPPLGGLHVFSRVQQRAPAAVRGASLRKGQEHYQ